MSNSSSGPGLPVTMPSLLPLCLALCNGLKKPSRMTKNWLSGDLKPRDFGYALCLYRAARRNFEEKELFEAGRKMLQANLQEEWLGGGQFIRAATWLKIVYWRGDETLTPLQTVLKAYENMPKVPRRIFCRLNDLLSVK